MQIPPSSLLLNVVDPSPPRPPKTKDTKGPPGAPAPASASASTPSSSSASSSSSYSAPSLLDTAPARPPGLEQQNIIAATRDAAPAEESGADDTAQTHNTAQTQNHPADKQNQKQEDAGGGSPLLTCTFRPRELVRRVVGSGVGGERPTLAHAPAFTVAAASALEGASSSASGNPQHREQQPEKERAAREEKEAKEAKEAEEWEFRPARVPDGISLRNFGIQVPIYATLSDIVLYSPRGLSSPALRAHAARFVAAVKRKRRERCVAMGVDLNSPDAPLEYNVFVLDADARALRAAVPELMMRVFEGGERRGVDTVLHPANGEEMDVDGTPPTHADTHDAPVAVPIHPDADAATTPNTVDFGQRERDEMRELTRASEILSVFPPSVAAPKERAEDDAAGEQEGGRGKEDLATTTTASHWRPLIGQVFLGNSGDVPLADGGGGAGGGEREDPFAWEATNSPRDGLGYDVCVECHEMAPFPSVAHLRAAEDHLTMLDRMWEERVRGEGGGEGGETRVRPPPNANAVIHLPFPSAPSNTAQTMNALLPVIAFLERCLRPVVPTPPPPPTSTNSGGTPASGGPGSRRWSTFPAAVSPASFFPSPPPPPTPPGAPRTRSLTSPAPSPAPTPSLPVRTRPLKVLIYSSDGYTESSPLALSLLMAVRRLSLPEAYLELQVVKRRSFFVYPGELGLLRRVEARIGGGEVFAPARLGRRMSGAAIGSTGSLGSVSGAQASASIASVSEVAAAAPSPPPHSGGARPSAKSVSFATGAVMVPPVMVPSQGAVTRTGRPRARTSPWLPSFGDHQSWFNDPRFDGSFPSRVLPFLYLGNLNHASNAYMLHALGITHVVSVGECALVPPPGHCPSTADSCTSATCRAHHNSNAHFIQGKGPGNQGSLWIEEREGRIKVLDIQGVCDDGIDTLEPQLEPICEWIEKARQDGGQVLVHCRVGVSRSATVTIAYVMKHLSLPLVDAYLIVRSRRLSVLIQPNMRLLYNLCGWEIKLAKERAQGDEARLRKELARTLTWPYLAKEVHALNEKYLH
ncbi:hypothetical protein C8F04DRAFT_1314148 [Mycena alexandri]|uniref:Protein-tyrosine-phosphatase n=1 Tax=Mycena alexandri TaxID=1745969 RepID=A0AAD6X5Y0_9AGAR|nr:hypothetical protein C8F04DRAFT_1314148 [Mycena alexandri]